MAKHTLAEIRAEYDRLDALCGVDTSKIEIRISTRATRRFGCCYCGSRRDPSKPDGKCFYPISISISEFILDCDEQFWDTIRHEYCHALVAIMTEENHGHDEVWQAACKEVGCSPDRLATDAEAIRVALEKRSAAAKYVVECKDCGRKWSYVRINNVVKALGRKQTCTCPCGSHNLVLMGNDRQVRARA